MKKLLTAVLLFVFISKGVAQNPNYEYAKEKIYLQTNHMFFKPGEQLYFKLYLVTGTDQTPSLQSNAAYVEVISPSGNVLQTMAYKVDNGYAEGSYDFTEQAPGGVYKLRAFTTWMQNETDSTFFTKEITVQQVIAPRILMKLDFPKKGYGPGDEVIADYSVRNLGDQPIKNLAAKFVVAIAGKTIETSGFKTNSEGKYQLKFKLPNDLASSDGLLNITIDYDAYIESISRSIPIVLNKIDLQFMPEGGTLVQGITGNMAFKAVNEFGKPVDIKGEVLDSKGNRVVAFESYHFGMGQFSFTSKEGESYIAKITSPQNITQQYEMPKADYKGVVMNIVRANKDLLIKLKASENRQVKLVGQTKSVNYYVKDIFLQKGEQLIAIDTTLFPAGIAQFTLYGDNDMPIAERLIFLNSHKTVQVKITTDKIKYLPREKISMVLKTTDEEGNAIPSNFSLSVVDDKLWSLADDKQHHILSWLLMGSELKGRIEEPQFYFKKDEPEAAAALDLVMLTHGYRYFDYIPYVLNEGKLKFTADLDNIVSGNILNEKGQPVKANIYLVNPFSGGKALYSKTAEDGMFFFANMPPNHNYYLIAQSFRTKEKISINVQQNGVGYHPFKTTALKQVMAPSKMNALSPGVVAQKKPVTEKVNVAITIIENDDFDKTFGKPNQLNEVVVVGYAMQKRKNVTGAVAVVMADELMQVRNVDALLQGKVAGVNIIQAGNPGAAVDIRIRGIGSVAENNSPLYVVNGMPVEKLEAHINPNDIESITVLKDAAAVALFGCRAANGVIIIDNKKLRQERLNINLTKKYYFATLPLRMNGPQYTVARRFYVPQYKTLETNERTDFRETIYWNPVVQTDKNGAATIEFYNSDASTTFRAIAEGIAYNGKLGRAETTYAVQNAMSADAKIPPYLTVGDKAMIPLVIKNNSGNQLDITVSISPIENIKIGNYAKVIVLGADSSKQILVPIEAIAAMKGQISFIVSRHFNTETITLPITAADKGFPVVETFSGNTSAVHQFTINKMVPGSLITKLKLFDNVEGQLLDGIESMLREPGGCFEQTSSTTYPNISILQYLKESGKSNPAVEKKALEYIENGYKRLIGFETAQNGFEWFGKTPPHEALTAYGLLEFTDMQQFISVDKKMLARTKEFLLSRRDGKGAFTLASGGYDRFASVPNKIANIYIVYALTKAGIGNEIQLEYETAVKKAIESKDAYLMAMMALAASNMKDDKSYIQFMNLLNSSYQKNSLQSETSVVNSRDISLNVECMSLYAMALAKEPTPEIGVMADLITKILSSKSYYGYGSTQATVLALQAVVAYSKIAGAVAKEAQVSFLLNEKNITPGNKAAEVFKDGGNTFAVRYIDAKKTIPYNFEVSYATFTPPNSDKAALTINTKLNSNKAKIGETVRMEIAVTNTQQILQPMAIAKIGIPAGLEVQPWQLKEIMEQNKAAYYEIFDNYLVLYWMGFAINETKTIQLDLKASIPGNYKGKASNVYLYYTPEYKQWNDGVEIEIGNQ